MPQPRASRCHASAGFFGYAGFLRCQVEEHLFALQLRHLLHLAQLFQVVGKAQQEHFALLFEENGTSAEEHVGTHLIALGKEFLRMLELELVVVLVCLRSEAYLFYLLLNFASASALSASAFAGRGTLNSR